MAQHYRDAGVDATRVAYWLPMLCVKSYRGIRYVRRRARPRRAASAVASMADSLFAGAGLLSTAVMAIAVARPVQVLSSELGRPAADGSVSTAKPLYVTVTQRVSRVKGSITCSYGVLGHIT